MQPSFSYPDVVDPETRTITRVFRRCESSPGLIIFKDSQPEYTSLKDIIQVSSNSPPSPFWKTNRRKPQPCRCWNGEVLINKTTTHRNRKNKRKVIPILDDTIHPEPNYNDSRFLTGTNFSSSMWYSSTSLSSSLSSSAIIIAEASALLLCPNSINHESERCIPWTSLIPKKMLNFFYKLSQKIRKLFSSMAGKGYIHRD